MNEDDQIIAFTDLSGRSTGFDSVAQEAADDAALARWQAIADTPPGELLALAERSVAGTARAITIHLADGAQWVQVEDNSPGLRGVRVYREVPGTDVLAGTLEDALRVAIDCVQGEMPRYV